MKDSENTKVNLSKKNTVKVATKKVSKKSKDDIEAKDVNSELKTDVTSKNIVPSYVSKKDKNLTGKSKSKTNKSRVMFKSKLSIIIPVVTVILILVIGFSIFKFIDSFKYKPYNKFEDFTKQYSFDKVYNSGTAKTSNKVTKSEAVKMVLATAYNESDISGFAKKSQDDYENAIWVDYAKHIGIIGENEINKENESGDAKYVDVIRYFANAKIKIVDKPLDVNLDQKPKDYEEYKEEEKQAIADMINNKIIVENINKIDGYKNIFKGKLNEMIINFSNKYNTITPEGEKLNINQEKTPSNAAQYPYTLASIEKEVYEIPFIIKNEKEFKNPKAIYQDKKATFEQIKSLVEKYYNTLLNIDYLKIDEANFYSEIEDCLNARPDKNNISQYIKYVKDNKISIEGKANLQMPIIYFDGLHYRARVKLDYKINYSATKDNLIYGDFRYQGYGPPSKIEYQKDTYSIFVDTKLSSVLNSNSIYLIEDGMYTMTLKPGISGMHYKEVE